MGKSTDVFRLALKNTGTCPVCGESNEKMTGHHVLPKCWWNGEGPIVYLCRFCHNLLELVIEDEEGIGGGQLNDKKYILIARRFLQGYYFKALRELPKGKGGKYYRSLIKDRREQHRNLYKDF